MKNEINKPRHQEDENQSKFSKTVKELDLCKLTLGVAGLGAFGGYLYPTIVNPISIGLASSGLITVGIGAIGCVAGALAVSTFCKAIAEKDLEDNKSLEDELNSFANINMNEFEEEK